jgi:UDP-N-acetylmuramyl-tripeptide synthetase
LLKELSALLRQIQDSPAWRAGTAIDSAQLEPLQISGVTNDSRKVQSGNLFFAIDGEHHHGDDFAQMAANKGALCVFTQNPDLSCSVPVISLSDVRLALSMAANYYFDTPSGKLRLLGVTGTNGKTTTTHLVEHILLRAGHSVGLIGTLGARWQTKDGKIERDDLGQTTPQAPKLQETLATMVSRGVSHVTMEVSSHSLALKHVFGCQFAGVCLTNITQDHLDFHKSMEQYWQAKLKLFELISQSQAKNKHAIVNLDEPLAGKFLKALDSSVKPLTFSWNKKADVQLESAKFDFSGSHLQLATPYGKLDLKLKLNGPFNVYNVMAALLICLSEGVDASVCKGALEEFDGVPGRFQIVASETIGRQSSAEPLCIVDYAHTPDGLQNILKAARVLVPAEGKLIVVFGCGGDRDTSKRPQMGEIAEKLADCAIVTSDNPRSEDPKKIIAEILAGITRLSHVQVEADRAKAINMAVSQAGGKDVVVIAGKGHEDYQILADRTISFDDRLQVKNALQLKQQRV